MNLSLIITILIISYAICAPFYDPQKTNVVNLNPKNFDTQITQNRSKSVVSFIHFYTKNDGKSNTLKNEIAKMSNEYDGMFKFAALDCNEFKELCNKQDVKEFPTFKIYPPLPAPVFPYEQEINSKTIISSLGRFIDNKTIELNSNNIDNFKNDKPNLPKVYLFTDKVGVPLIYKVLAIQFNGKMDFGVVRSEEKTIVGQFKVNKYPTILVTPVGAKKNEVYPGKNQFKEIYDFLNIYSETFFKVGEDKTSASSESKADKPWLKETLPELNKNSANDICFKVEGVICVVVVSNGKPDSKTSNLVSELQDYLSPKINRGLKYKFSWIDFGLQQKFINIVGSTNVPQLLLINNGSRKRFHVSKEEFNMESFKSLFDKLASGDLRFSMFSQNTYPDLE